MQIPSSTEVVDIQAIKDAVLPSLASLRQLHVTLQLRKSMLAGLTVDPDSLINVVEELVGDLIEIRNNANEQIKISMS